MRHGQGFRETQDDRTGELGTRSLVLIASKDDVVIVKADVEILDTAAGTGMGTMATQELESHGWRLGGRSGKQMAVRERV